MLLKSPNQSESSYETPCSCRQKLFPLVFYSVFIIFEWIFFSYLKRREFLGCQFVWFRGWMKCAKNWRALNNALANKNKNKNKNKTKKQAKLVEEVFTFAKTSKANSIRIALSGFPSKHCTVLAICCLTTSGARTMYPTWHNRQLNFF